MTSNAIIQGTFADLKTVKTRSVVQMIVEVPIERGEEVVKMFGFPQPGSEVSVAVARLVQQKAPEPEKTRQQWDNVPRAQQAGILCGEDGFRQFIGVETAEDAKHWIYEHCGVTSRSEIDAKAPVKWDQLVADYRFHQRYEDMRP